MRVFDTFYYNLAERATFAKAAPYLAKMLEETGFPHQKTAFSVYATSDSVPKKACGMFPQLTKYAKKADRAGLTSAPEDFAARAMRSRKGILHGFPVTPVPIRTATAMKPIFSGLIVRRIPPLAGNRRQQFHDSRAALSGA